MSTPKRNLPCDECLVFACCKGRYEKIINKPLSVAQQTRKCKAAQTMVSRCSILNNYCEENLDYVRKAFEEKGFRAPVILIENPFETSDETTKNWITFPFNH